MVVSRFKIINGKSVAVVEYFGQPKPLPLRPGLHFLMPFNRIRFKLDLRQQQIEKKSSVKTKDDAFIDIQWVVRYSIKDDNDSIMQYCYKVEQPIERLIFKVENELRRIISEMDMKEIYSQRDQISTTIMEDQSKEALETGLWIDGIVVEQPIPPQGVQDALNNKLAAIAKKEASAAEADAEMIKRVGIAKAESESKKLQGEGIAQERNAIVAGFSKSIDDLRTAIPQATEADLLKLILTTMQCDMVTTASNSGKSTVIFVPVEMQNQVGNLANLANMAKNT
jgi:regulator of protease activity HflC (stomatin/prohibitin superfamily)